MIRLTSFLLPTAETNSSAGGIRHNGVGWTELFGKCGDADLTATCVKLHSVMGRKGIVKGIDVVGIAGFGKASPGVFGKHCGRI
jgi:hypothetical protein